ncbi:pyrroline-5-carboxylate reductase [Labrys wisconsinensis]|uniref:Pyrroline-5-carboxylate reductase n=1 Tax=Labrys wisconsinensis TaxID=425677 RepID=A0ABU0JHD1_9HYPH|nr:pyrroline-5-carboxylate reductase [Labrys wisconsinensis]MDQ0473697.1 pyrroline-5-carboxylate reductase [Labrys wisconsinensis]
MSLDIGGKLLLLGAGKMGGAMLEGWLKLGLDPKLVAAMDPHPPADTAALLSRAGVAVNPDLAAFGAPAVVLLAIKPQMMGEALPAVAAGVVASTLVISIMAGKTIAGIAALLPPGTAIVRAMPNTPAAVGRGITVAVPNAAVTTAQRAAADALLRSTGAVEWIEDEGLIDAVTAVSGSGPAYVFHLVEALAEAGVAAGLPADLAMRLARETVAGSGELLHRSDQPAAVLRQNVTSPGGTTAAALAVLMAEGGLTPLMQRAVAAAKTRAGELAG